MLKAGDLVNVVMFFDYQTLGTIVYVYSNTKFITAEEYEALLKNYECFSVFDFSACRTPAWSSAVAIIKKDAAIIATKSAKLMLCGPSSMYKI